MKSRIFRAEALVARRGNSVKKACLAQGLAEYAIAGTCLGVVCLVGLGLFSTQLGTLLGGFKAQLNGSALAERVHPVLAPSTPTSTGQASPKIVLITLPDGSQMALDGVPMDPGQLIETSGVNGYTAV